MQRGHVRLPVCAPRRVPFPMTHLGLELVKHGVHAAWAAHRGGVLAGACRRLQRGAGQKLARKRQSWARTMSPAVRLGHAIALALSTSAAAASIASRVLAAMLFGRRLGARESDGLVSARRRGAAMLLDETTVRQGGCVVGIAVFWCHCTAKPWWAPRRAWRRWTLQRPPCT